MPHPRILILLSLFIITSIPSLAFPQILTGKVISVADGDTITVLDNRHRQTRIRLYGIDTPEKGQAFGRKAKQFTAGLVAGKIVKVKIYDVDKYGRSVGVVFVHGRNVNEEIIRAGYGWQYRKYCRVSFCSKWLTIEQMARNVGLGLWRDKHPVPPWEWRKGRSRNHMAAGNRSARKAIQGGTGIYHGNVRSHVFHGPGCRHYNCKNCTRVFRSKQEAMRAGYRPHRQCVR